MRITLTNLVLFNLCFLKYIYSNPVTTGTICNHWSTANYANYVQYSFNNTLYQIDTVYYLNYPSALKNRLSSYGYTIIYNTQNSCGWYDISTVYNGIVITGSIYVQINSDGLPIFDQKVIENTEAILSSEYPSSEIGLIVFFGLVFYVITVYIIIMNNRR